MPAWLENIWESENGQSKFEITATAYLWDRPMCWIDNETIAYWGIGEDEDEMEDAVCLYNLAKKAPVKVIKEIPRSDLFFDRYLFTHSEAFGLSIWDLESEALLFEEKNLRVSQLVKFEDRYLTRVSNEAIEYFQLV